MASSVLQGEITFFSKSKGDKITFVPDKRVVIEIGSNPNCDIRIEDADSLHMLIQLDTETGKVRKRRNQSEPQYLSSKQSKRHI